VPEDTTRLGFTTDYESQPYSMALLVLNACWSDGVLEYWSIGLEYITPILHRPRYPNPVNSFRLYAANERIREAAFDMHVVVVPVPGEIGFL
jgi:hypothetical protein